MVEKSDLCYFALRCMYIKRMISNMSSPTKKKDKKTIRKEEERKRKNKKDTKERASRQEHRQDRSHRHRVLQRVVWLKAEAGLMCLIC